MKNFTKVSFIFVLLVSLFSCSEEDIELTPWPADADPVFSANVDGSAFAQDSTGVDAYAYTTEIEYDFNDEDNNVIEEGTYDAIRILAANGSNSIALVFPSETVEGTYSISSTQGYFLANYLMNTGEESATNRANSGLITITLHNQDANYVEGYFDFETSEHHISDGVFKTFYAVSEE
ncbi:hypothetical protein SAMN05216480_10756 [Pustulibacterium marinum]|uniref:Uncharacterized protein n=1 Tax=Pustulibacterium marinum TaxID=1224947 RepID=A0A1I7H4P3_9FLAO|nr:DUF6252 family protein [Pustulibacterium marinum]SFU55677.1 hypothetical protein SAMN05216480_10756 [Pustulibacterium marinum]